MHQRLSKITTTFLIQTNDNSSPTQTCKVIKLIFISTIIALFSITSLSAKQQNDWQSFLVKYKNGECESLNKELTTLSKISKSRNPDLWMRSNIIHVKCLMHLAKFAEAKKLLQRTPLDSEKDTWTYQKLRFNLQTNQFQKSVVLIEELLQLPQRKYYLERIRRHLKDEFKSNKEVLILFPLLHLTRKNYRWFLTDFDIHALYIRGAKLSKTTIQEKYRFLGWQFPIDEKTAISSHKSLNKQDLRSMSPIVVRNRIQTLTKLKLHSYLLKHLPELRKTQGKKVQIELGEAFLNSLFAKREYSKIFNSYKSGLLTKTWSLPKEVQLYWAARSHLRKKEINEGKNLIQILQKINPTSKHLPILYDKIATHYKWKFQHEKANYWLDQLLVKFPKHRLAVSSAWKNSWSNFQQGNKAKALLYLKKGLKTGIVNSEVRAKFLYWQGKWQHSNGRVDLSEKSFLQLIRRHPNTYYGMRLLSGEEIPETAMVAMQLRKTSMMSEPPLPKQKAAQQLLKRAEYLFDIAESEHAVKELMAGLKIHVNHSLSWHISRMLHRRGKYHPLQRVIANYYLPDLITLEIGEHPIWELAYPRPYWKELKKYARKAGIDPYFVLAIMREESHFDPQAISSSKAMGLMQLMPATAKEVAQKQKIHIKDRAHFFDPYLNTKLGTFYLGGLAIRFNSELIYTAGSYNAGPGNMNKWLKRWQGKSLDAFVEQIPFKETQNYVKRVYRSYKLYKQIYQS